MDQPIVRYVATWPAPRAPIDEAGRSCDYFVVCDRPADGLVRHPVAGDVPTCRRCAELAGQALHPFGTRGLPAAG